MSLKRQVATSFFWVALSQLLGRVLSFFTYLILAKLLAPSLFGLVSMAGLAIAALQFLQDVGFDAALIYRRDDLEEASDTAFFVVIASSTLIFVIAASAAPLVAAFFRTPEVVPVLRALAFAVVIQSFGRVAYIRLERELDFRRRVIPELAANLIGSASSIGLALLGVGVWSLVWGQLIRVTVSSTLVWFFVRWRPRFRFNVRLARDLFRYGKHIVASQGLIFLITNSDNAVVGRYAGDAALGFYGFAYNLSNLPATQITSMVNQVMFPAFSKLGADAAQARARYYLTVVRYVAWVAVPISVATILFAREFVQGLYGDVWAAAIIPLQILAIYGFIRSIAANMGSIFRAMGKPQWLTYIALWRLITMLVFLYPAVKLWGIVGVSALSAVVAVIDFYISATLVGRLIDAPWRAYARIVLPPLLAALIGGEIAHLAYPGLHLPKVWMNLGLAGIMMVIIYLALVWLAEPRFREAVREAWRYVQRMLKEHSAFSPVVEPPAKG